MAVKDAIIVTLTESIALSANTNYALLVWRSQEKSAFISP
ncbi:hypothetical protein UFOVP1369_21 [uncultured Caudovirales phage]|uniref:Uncharacterized protein n=1 Tax=uncultured Caudovirales phage TaxID=2100421 RepID=A0A6J5RVC6_9CAUD|nr:hypothetical protein UFOVP1369_21 [uncultured Caudovirales phage]